jgi:anti-anti-sigma regulatory factor
MTITLLPDCARDCAKQLRSALDMAHNEAVTIDMHGVPHLPLDALAEVAEFRRRNTAQSIVILNANPVVVRTLHITGFNKLLTIENDV